MKLKSFQIFRSILVLAVILVGILFLAGCPEPPSSVAEITAFNFLAANNSVLDTDVDGIVSGNSISADVPWKIDLAGLVASFEYTGASIAVGTVQQVSGTTANDFSSAVVYTVTAEDGSTADYSVTVSYDHVPSYLSSFEKTDITTSASSSNYIQSADIDGDGDYDLVGTTFAPGSIHWWENTTGDGTAWTEHSVDSSVAGVVFALAEDIDGDGDHDIVGTAWTGGYISWWENSDDVGLSWTEYSVSTSLFEPTCLDAADFDGDGDVDIFSAEHGSGEIIWWENTEDANPSDWEENWIEHIIQASYTYAYWVSIGDLTGDGLPDVAGASGGLNKFSYWINDGTMPDDGTAWTEVLIEDDMTGAISMSLADFDGDGDLDVCGATLSSDTIAWFENNGDGSSWTTNTLKSDFDYAMTIGSSDIDLDGDMDILACAQNDNSIIVWENSAGDASEWAEHLVTDSFSGARWVDSGDVNGDGFDDIIGAALSADSDVAWWKIIE